jgi:D-alanine--D-alanine ligase
MSNESKNNLHVAVLKGGWSAEREVSLSSGAECANALRGEGYTVTEIDVDRTLPTVLAEVKPDVVFNALHGPYGEDGTIQGVLEVMSLPYTHSGVLASALAMDKGRAKAVFRDVGLPCAESVVVDRKTAASHHQMEPPYVIKPVTEGSSVGIQIVEEGANQPPQNLLDEDWSHGDQIMIEKFVPGRELTVSVMGDRPLEVFCRIVEPRLCQGMVGRIGRQHGSWRAQQDKHQRFLLADIQQSAIDIGRHRDEVAFVQNRFRGFALVLERQFHLAV